MQLPGKNASSEAYLVFGEYIEGASEAWLDAETLTAEQQKAVLEVKQLIQPSVANLRSAEQATGAAELAAIMARARFRVRDVILDLCVMRVSDAVLNGPAGRSRDHASYQHVFRGNNASKITGTKMRKEPDVVSRLLDRYNDIPDFDGKAPARDALAVALKKSYDALEKVEETEDAVNSTVDAELLARLSLRGVAEQVYGKLIAAFPGQKSFVESFFPKRDTAKGEDEGETEESGDSAEG